MYEISIDKSTVIQLLNDSSKHYAIQIRLGNTDYIFNKNVCNVVIGYISIIGIKSYVANMVMLDTWILRLDITLDNEINTNYIIDIK